MNMFKNGQVIQYLGATKKIPVIIVLQKGSLKTINNNFAPKDFCELILSRVDELEVKYLNSEEKRPEAIYATVYPEGFFIFCSKKIKHGNVKICMEDSIGEVHCYVPTDRIIPYIETIMTGHKEIQICFRFYKKRI